MRILVACERSGVVRRAFRARGHYAVSCDLAPAEDGADADHHIQGDVCLWLHRRWDMLIAFPDCTYLCVSGMHWNGRIPGRAAKTEAAVEFFMLLANAPIPRKCIENPVGIMSTRWRKPDQIIQPHQFGHDASKATCLWLENLPPLKGTRDVAPRIVNGRPRWAN